MSESIKHTITLRRQNARL